MSTTLRDLRRWCPDIVRGYPTPPYRDCRLIIEHASASAVNAVKPTCLSPVTHKSVAGTQSSMPVLRPLGSTMCTAPKCQSTLFVSSFSFAGRSCFRAYGLLIHPTAVLHQPQALPPQLLLHFHRYHLISPAKCCTHHHPPRPHRIRKGRLPRDHLCPPTRGRRGVCARHQRGCNGCAARSLRRARVT